MDTVKKEMLIAGLIGLFAGLGLGFLASNVKNIKISTSFKKPVPMTSPTEAPSGKTANESILSLSLSSPDDESVTTLDTITIEGKTDPKAIVVISTEEDETIVTPVADGSFSLKVTLTPEENQLVVTSYKDSESKIIRRLVVYDKPEE